MRIISEINCIMLSLNGTSLFLRMARLLSKLLVALIGEGAWRGYVDDDNNTSRSWRYTRGRISSLESIVVVLSCALVVAALVCKSSKKEREVELEMEGERGDSE